MTGVLSTMGRRIHCWLGPDAVHVTGHVVHMTGHVVHVIYVNKLLAGN